MLTLERLTIRCRRVGRHLIFFNVALGQYRARALHVSAKQNLRYKESTDERNLDWRRCV